MNKAKRIGILGGGQLARMSAFAAIRMGFDIAIFEKEKKSPAGRLTPFDFSGNFNNKIELQKFLHVCDIITLENEFIDHEILRFIEKYGKKVIPGSHTISLIQDKYLQKSTLKRNGINVPDFVKVYSHSSFSSLIKRIGVPFLLKSRKMGYDGYGNALIKNKEDFLREYQKLTQRHAELMAENFVEFSKELAIMVVRTKKEIVTYPLVETIQKNHICHIVIAPAEVSNKVKQEAEKIAKECVIAVNGYGIFGIEFFLTKDGKLLVNEMAPRPHNSGHYTIEACRTSQFENHIRSVLGLPLGDTSMIKPYAVMINILGKRNGTGNVKNYEEVFTEKDIHLHIYGKTESREGRKLGHITVTGNNPKKILRKAKRAEKKIII